MKASTALGLAALLWCVTAWSSPGPENVLLVANDGDAVSVRVAREYMRLRRIPAANLLLLKDVPREPVIPVAEFRLRILSPILEAIQSRGLSRQVDAIVYSTGFPYAVDVSAEMAGRTFPRFITQPASLTGLTYLYEPVLRSDIEYLSMDANWYYRDNPGRLRPLPWSAEDRALAGLMQERSARATEGLRKNPGDPQARRLLTEAVALAESLAERHPDSAELLYDLACLRALTGRQDAAVQTLRAAVKAGWRNVSHTETDPDLAGLRDRPDFKALVETMRKARAAIAEPQPFRAMTRWGRDGLPASKGPGKRYLLCAMLGYIGPRANTEDEVLNCLRRSVRADHTRPRGTVYFMASSDTARTGPRQWAFEPARDALRSLGVRAEVLPGVLPENRRDVMGAVVGAASFQWTTSGSEILPGAFCDHLTSFAGAMTGAGQTLLSEWIRHGAAGSSGTVTEPYNIAAKFPTALLHVFYAKGATLAEAFYQSVSGPYQQLLVGDPLCAPWAPRITVTVEGLRQGAMVRRPTTVRARCTGAAPVQRYELYVDGVLRATAEPGKPLVLNPRGLATGQHEARVVAVAGRLEWRGRAILLFRTLPAGGRP